MNSLAGGVKWNKPPGLICHVCGREYGTTSLAIHLPQCVQLWKDRQKLLPRSERRPVPKATFSVEQLASMKIDSKDMEAIAAFNEQQFDTFKEKSLLPCENCGRRFLAEKLPVHQRSCTADRPAAAVGSHRIRPALDLNGVERPQTITNLPSIGSSSFSGEAAEIKIADADLPIKAATSASLSLDSAALSAAEDMPLRPCMHCSRSFALDRVEKHEAICSGHPATRSALPSKPLQQQQARPSTAAPPSAAASASSNTSSNWKSKHAEFQATLQYSKKLSAMQAAGVNLATLPPPPRSENPDFIQCPHCLRRYNPTAGARHIAACANIINKPKPPPQLRGATAAVSSMARPQTAAVRSMPAVTNRTPFAATLPSPTSFSSSSRTSASFAQLSQTTSLGEIKNKNHSSMRSPGSRQSTTGGGKKEAVEAPNAQITAMQKQIEMLTQSVLALTQMQLSKQQGG